jgi:hypothetical protein
MAQGVDPERPGERPGLLARLRGNGGGRPSFVYLVVGVVALTLTVLLAIIYFSASEREKTSPPICTDITLARAERAILSGEVDRLTIVYDEAPLTPTSERYGPVLAKLDFADGTCSNLPQGVAHQDVVYTVAGVIAFYNENTDGQKVEVVYQKTANLREDLFALPTATPMQTPTAAPTRVATATATVTATPVPTRAPATPAGSIPARVGTPAASPAPLPLPLRPTATSTP